MNNCQNGAGGLARRIVRRSLLTKMVVGGAVSLVAPLVWVGVARAQGCSPG